MTSAEEIKSRLDIVDVINEYIHLKAAGANWKARCPFHDEKSPSFMVSKAKQMWHCFGCGEGGDIFSFVMKQEGLEFPDALRLLAAKAGVQVTMESPKRRTERESVGKALAASVKFWQDQLWKNEKANAAREYLQNERKLLPETIREWKLGFAPDSWEALVNYLAELSFPEEEIVKAGVAVRKMSTGGRSVYDRFRNRVIFPLTNAHGQVVGLTGRVLPATLQQSNTGVPRSGGSDAEAKYVNTPETVLYKKGELLYGLDKAKASIRELNMAIIVEGNVDVISSHQGGVTNVVAASGTALTVEQVRLLKRYTSKVAFAFDADAAGEAATLRGLTEALAGGLDVFLIQLPSSYKDPDECIRQDVEIWKKAVLAAEPLFDYYFRRAKEERDLNSLEDKRLILQTLLPIMGRVSDQVAMSHYLQKLSVLVKVPEKQLREMISRPREAKQDVVVNKTQAIKKDSEQALSEWLLSALSRSPLQITYLMDVLTPEMLSAKVAPLYKHMLVFYTEQADKNEANWLGDSFTKYLAQLPQDSQELTKDFDVLLLLADKEFADYSVTELQQEIISTSKRLKKRHLRRELRDLESSIREAEAATPQNQDQLQNLINQFQTLSSELIELD